MLLLGDFNVGVEDFYLIDFCLNYKLASMVNKPKCFKNPSILLLYRSNLNKLSLLVSGFMRNRDRLSDFHKWSSQSWRQPYEDCSRKSLTNVITIFFTNDNFKQSLQKSLSQSWKAICNNAFNNFTHSCNSLFAIYAHWKKVLKERADESRQRHN